jgi:hypothetical protein
MRDCMAGSSSEAPMPVVEIVSAVGGGLAAAVEEGELPLGAVSVAVEQHVHGLMRGGAASQ